MVIWLQGMMEQMRTTENFRTPQQGKPIQLTQLCSLLNQMKISQGILFLIKFNEAHSVLLD